MSLLRILATTSSAPALAPNPAPLAPAPTSDPVLTYMRPNSLRRIIATLEVATDGTKPYVSPQAAITAARALQQAWAISEKLSTPTPDHWVQILVHPGTYKVRNLHAVGFISLHSTTGNPADVTLEEDPKAPGTGLAQDWDGDVIAGGGFYEGFTIRQPYVDPAQYIRGKYLMHNIEQGAAATVFANCRLRQENANANALWGQNAAYDASVTFYGCSWHSVAPNQVMYGIGTVNLIKTIGNAGNFGAGGGDMSPYDALWVDSTSYFPNGVVIGAPGELHIPSGAASSYSYTGTKLDSRTGWPMPVAGLAPKYQLSLYGSMPTPPPT